MSSTPNKSTAQIIARKVGSADFQKAHCMLCHKLTNGHVQLKFNPEFTSRYPVCVTCMDKHNDTDLAKELVKTIFSIDCD